jgi:hypothetical protein
MDLTTSPCAAGTAAINHNDGNLAIALPPIPVSAEPIQEISGLKIRFKKTPTHEQQDKVAQTITDVIASTPLGKLLLSEVSAHLDNSPFPCLTLHFQEDGDGDDDGPHSNPAEHELEPLIFTFRSISADFTGTNRRQDPTHKEAVFRANQATFIFIELVRIYCQLTKEWEVAKVTTFGIRRFPVLAFQQELKFTRGKWADELQEYAFGAEQPGEDRTTAITAIIDWYNADKTDQPLQLVSMKLIDPPPIRLLPVKWLELNNNRIRAFPPGYFPETLRILTIGNNPVQSIDPKEVPDECFISNQPWQTAAIDENENVPRANIEHLEENGYNDKVMAAIYSTEMLSEAVEQFLAASTSGHPNSQKVKFNADAWHQGQAKQPNSAKAFTLLLKRLRRINPNQSQPLSHQFTPILIKMQDNPTLMENCLQIARNGTESCQDNVLLTTNNIYVAYINSEVEDGKYNNNLPELLKISESMFYLHELSNFIIRLLPKLKERLDEKHRATAEEERPELDAIEEYLKLLVPLCEPLNLSLFIVQAEHTHLAVINDEEVELARKTVVERKPTEYPKFLSQWQPLLSLIKRLAPKLWRHNEHQLHAMHNDRGLIYPILNYLWCLFPNTDATQSLFIRPNDFSVLQMPHKIFQTPYERSVCKKLENLPHVQENSSSETIHNPIRDDIVTQVCRETAEDLNYKLRLNLIEKFLTKQHASATASANKKTAPAPQLLRWLHQHSH